MLQKDPKMRLGSGERDAQEVKEHPFFSSIDWNKLEQGLLPVPMVEQRGEMNGRCRSCETNLP